MKGERQREREGDPHFVIHLKLLLFYKSTVNYMEDNTVHIRVSSHIELLSCMWTLTKVTMIEFCSSDSALYQLLSVAWWNGFTI